MNPTCLDGFHVLPTKGHHRVSPYIRVVQVRKWLWLILQPKVYRNHVWLRRGQRILWHRLITLSPTKVFHFNAFTRHRCTILHKDYWRQNLAFLQSRTMYSREIFRYHSVVTAYVLYRKRWWNYRNCCIWIIQWFPSNRRFDFRAKWSSFVQNILNNVRHFRSVLFFSDVVWQIIPSMWYIWCNDYDRNKNKCLYRIRWINDSSL